MVALCLTYSKVDSRDGSQPEEMSRFQRQTPRVLSTREMPVDPGRRRKPSRGFESHLLRFPLEPASGQGRLEELRRLTAKLTAKPKNVSGRTVYL